MHVNRERFGFLGFNFKRAGGKLLVTPKEETVEKFKDTVRAVTNRKQPVKPKEMIGRLNSIIRGWENYFKIGNVKSEFERFDQWIRTRIRTFIEKKISRYARMRIPNHILKTEYKLASLRTLIKSHSL